MRGRTGDQYPLFDLPATYPNGFTYLPEFITNEEEEEILRHIRELTLRNAPFHEYIAKRRIKGWWRSVPEWLVPVTEKLADWHGIPASAFTNALVSEYSPGTGVGWHRDGEPYRKIFGLSLGAWATFELRPNRNASTKEPVSLTAEPRSVYVMQGESRDRFQHRVKPTKALRYSITFRTI